MNSEINNENELNDSSQLPSIDVIDKITDISELKTILKIVIKRLDFVEINTAKLMEICNRRGKKTSNIKKKISSVEEFENFVLEIKSDEIKTELVYLLALYLF